MDQLNEPLAEHTVVDGFAGLRIALIYPLPGLASVPCLANACRLWARLGVSVAVFCVEHYTLPSPSFDEDEVHVMPHVPGLFKRAHIRLPQWLHGHMGRPYGWVVRTAGRPLARFFHANRTMVAEHRRHPFHCMIGVDPEGLLDAEHFARLLGIPLVYWSLELMFADELETASEQALKKSEMLVSQRCDLVVIQDELRAEALVQENRLESSHIALVPNSPLGPARRRRGQYITRRFGVSPETTTLLCAGTLADWSMSDELVHAAGDWPDDLALVMHSRTLSTAQPYIQELVDASRGANTYFSLDPLSNEVYSELLDSADIGIALYRTTGTRSTQRNVRLMGLSSGKLAAYLQHGLPVIVSDTHGPRELVRRFECGVVVDAVDEIAAAASVILRRYERFSENASLCFNELLRFEGPFQSLSTRILELR